VTVKGKSRRVLTVEAYHSSTQSFNCVEAYHSISYNLLIPSIYFCLSIDRTNRTEPREEEEEYGHRKKEMKRTQTTNTMMSETRGRGRGGGTQMPLAFAGKEELPLRRIRNSNNNKNKNILPLRIPHSLASASAVPFSGGTESIKKKQEELPLAFVGNGNGYGLRRNIKTNTNTIRNDDTVGNNLLAFSEKKGGGRGGEKKQKGVQPLAFVGNTSSSLQTRNKLRNAGIIGNDLLRNNKTNTKTTQRTGMGGRGLGLGYHHPEPKSKPALAFVYQKGARNINQNENISLFSKHNNCTTAVVRSSLSMPASLSTMSSSTGNNNNNNNNQSSSNHNAVFAPVVEELSPLGFLPPPHKPLAFSRLHRRSKSMSTPNLVTAAAAAAAAAAEDTVFSSPAQLDDTNLLNNLGMLVPISTGVSVSTMKRSKSASDLIVLSSAFSTRLMNAQHLLKCGEEGRDPLFYYEIKKTLGKGSMGSVALVKKRSQAVGGSARKKVRDTLTKHKRKQECFELPFGIGGLFRLCIEDSLRFTDDDDDDDAIGNNKKKNSITAMDHWWATSSTSDTSDCTSGYSISTRDLPDAMRSEESFDNDNYDDDNGNDYNTINSINHRKNNNSIRDSFGSYWSNSNSKGSGGSGSECQREHLYAMKSIHLSSAQDDNFVMELQNEIDILQKLDHPHIVKPMETFQYQSQIYIIMEVCSGGDLYSRDPYSEEETARIIHSVLSAVSYMHSCGVAHRDLKYENILFVNDSAKSPIKLIDFGLSKIYGSPCNNNTSGSTKQHSSTMSEGVGTIYTMAPEVLRGSYTKQADVWSIGVIAYMLLSSQMPFHGRTRTHIVEQILGGDYDFRGRRWKAISEAAKDFVCDLLVVDPHKRLDTDHALSCLWLNDKRFVATIRDPHPLEETQARQSMERYAGYTKLKKMAMMVVAHRSTNDEIGILRKIFQKYTSTTSASSQSTTTKDTKMKKSNSNGCISYAEFREVWKESGFPPAEMKSVFDACDLDGSGTLAYTEFLAATLGEAPTGRISEERLAEAFDRFDTDDSGTISVDNLAQILGTDMPRSEIQDIIDDACNIDNYGSGKAGSTSTIGKGGRRGRKHGSTRSNTNQSVNNGSGNGTTQHQHISYSAFLALWERKSNEKKGEVVLRTSHTNNTKPVRPTMKKLATGSRQQEQHCMLTGLVVPIEQHHRRRNDNDGRHGRRRNDVAAPLESINKALSTAAVTTNTRLLQ